MIVMKFGGTSVQDAAAITAAADIVRGRLGRSPVVVVSAMARVTDSLLRIAAAANGRKFDEASSILNELLERHLSTANNLLSESPDGSGLRSNLERDIRSLCSELEGFVRSVATLGELTSRSKDVIASFGERLSSTIVAAAFRERGIPAQLVDSRAFVVTDSSFTNAAPDMAETSIRTRRELLPLIEAGRVPVAQGFVGSTIDGITTTIGRGGGDYSAAIIGASLGVETIEIWTDVDGLMTADPRIVPGAKRIRVISFEEAAELSYFGAKVLHPSTVLPAVEQSIPVRIYNTRNPSSEGTVIMAEPRHSQNTVKSISFRRGVTIVNVGSTRMVAAHGFLRAIFEVFDRYRTSVDVVTTSEVSVSVTLDSVKALEGIERELRALGDVTVEPGKAIVCVVGDNLKFTPGVAARIFQAIGGINVNMISQGASEINVTFVINESEIERAVTLLHDDFFRECDPSVFA